MKTIYKVKPHFLIISIVVFAAILFSSVYAQVRPKIVAPSHTKMAELQGIYTQVGLETVERVGTDEYIYLPGNTTNGVKDLDTIYKAIAAYRARKQGLYPQKMVELYIDILTNIKAYGIGF